MVPPPQYFPAAHLIAVSHLTGPELVAHFQDFSNNLPYASTAPALVFEHLVANLSHSFSATLQVEWQGRSSALQANHLAYENLVTGLREKSSALEEQQQAYEVLTRQFHEMSIALEQGQISNERLTTQVQEMSCSLQASQRACEELTAELQQKVCTIEEIKLANESLVAQLQETSCSLQSCQLAKESLARELQTSSSSLRASVLAHRNLTGEVAQLNGIIRTSGISKDVTDRAVLGANHAIGVFDARGLIRDPHCTSKTVTFPNKYAMLPGLLFGLTLVHASRNANVRVTAYCSELRHGSFKIHLDSWSNTKLFGAACAWLAFESGDRDFQYGKYNTYDERNYTTTPLRNTRRIMFKHAYSSAPKVVVWLNNIDLGSKTNWRIKTFATQVTATGFTIHIATWSDTKQYFAVASWVAYPADLPGVSSGSFSTDGGESLIRPQVEYCSHEAFPTGVFHKPPRVFMALNAIDIDHQRDLRLLVKAEDVTADGMTWHLNAWSDTILYSAGASYIALA